jgi:hypothetical protein
LLLAVIFPNLAAARPLDRTVASGQSQIVARYYTWTGDCSSAFGTVKVLSKPAHGTISNHLVDERIGISRRKRMADNCFGRPIKALAVIYKSDPGYHGFDHFMLDATFNAYREVDAYTINVQ